MKRPRLTTSLPRPTRFTVGLTVVGLLAVIGAWMVNSSQRASLDAARVEQSSVDLRLAQQQAALREYESGDVLQGPALTAAVGPVEALLPAKSSSPIASFAAIEASARQFGLQATGLVSTLDYSAPDEAQSSYYPNLFAATGALRVAGPADAIEAWLGSLNAFPQMLTYTTSGISDADGIPTVDVQMRLWATDKEEWQAGQPG